MITQARIDGEIAPAGLDWITALRAPAIRELAEAGALQMSLFDQRDMAAITSPDYPGERLIVCRNRDLARERAASRRTCGRDRKDLAIIAAAVEAPASRCAARPRLRSRLRPVRDKIAKHLRPRDRRGELRVPSQGGGDRRRGGARRHLCRSHQLAEENARRRGCRRRLQKSRPGRARVPLP